MCSYVPPLCWAASLVGLMSCCPCFESHRIVGLTTATGFSTGDVDDTVGDGVGGGVGVGENVLHIHPG